MLPIDYQPKNELQDFDYKAIIHPLAHEHAEIYIFLDCPITFQNRATVHIFENLFLKYGGILYDRLRDELGLVYGIQSSFEKDLQVCQIYLTCELQYIETILDEVWATFSDFDKYFLPNKLVDFKNIISKKTDVSRDSLNAEVNFVSKTLMTFGKVENYDEYAQKLQLVSQNDISDFYLVIQKNLPQKKVAIVSKNPKIEQICQKIKSKSEKIKTKLEKTKKPLQKKASKNLKTKI